MTIDSETSTRLDCFRTWEAEYYIDAGDDSDDDDDLEDASDDSELDDRLNESPQNFFNAVNMAIDGETSSRLEQFKSWQTEELLSGIDHVVNEVESNHEANSDTMFLRIFSLCTLTEVVLPVILYISVINATIIFAIFLGQILF